MSALEILFEDHHLVVVNKPPTIPSQPDPTHSLSVLKMLKKRFRRAFFIINRLDRPASGLMILAKTSKAAAAFSRMTNERKIEKIYLAAVQNLPEPEEATLSHLLFKKNNKSYVTTDHKKAKEAILHYQLRKKTDRYFLLEITLQTGRFHQIRAQLGHIDCPIKGDVKYGARRANKDRSIHLHAYKIQFIHPFTGENIELTAPLPEDPVWNALL